MGGTALVGGLERWLISNEKPDHGLAIQPGDAPLKHSYLCAFVPVPQVHVERLPVLSWSALLLNCAACIIPLIQCVLFYFSVL